jgi:hypothetical protein
MSEKVRVTLNDETWEEMCKYSETALNDPEMVRQFVGLGLQFMKARSGGLSDAANGQANIHTDGDVDE